jgi:MATE family multidrug resistance protein
MKIAQIALAEGIKANPIPFLTRFSRLAVVNVLSNIIVPIASLLSIAFLGHFTELANLAGVGTAAVLVSYIYRLLGFLRISTTGLTAQAVGRNDADEIALNALRNVLLAFVVGLFIILVHYPIQVLWFDSLDVADSVSFSGQVYFQTRIWGAPAAAVNLVITGWLLGKEKSQWVFWITLLGAITSISLDYLFIVNWQLSSFGAGLSACITQYLMLIIGIICFFNETSTHLWKTVSQRLWKWSEYLELLSFNQDIFIRVVITRTILLLFIVMSSTLNTAVLTINTLSLEVFLFVLAIIEGVAFAAETLSGISKGEVETDSSHTDFSPDIVKTALATSLVIAFLASSLSVLFPQFVFSLLTNHAEVLEEVSSYIGWLLPVLCLIAIAFVIDSYFFSIGNGKSPRNAAVVGSLLGFLPFYAISYYLHNNHWLWFSLLMFMLVRAIYISLIYLNRASPVQDI